MKVWFKTFTIAVFTFYSCHEKKAAQQNLFLKADLKSVIQGIADENVVMGSAVGYGGEEPDQWRRYKALLAKASDSDLINFSSHRNPTVRCYSFDGLIERKNGNVYKILLQHLNDKDTIKTLFGCEGSYQMVGQYFIEAAKQSFLNPNEINTLDSLLIFDRTIQLPEKYKVLDSLKPLVVYYDRIKEMAQTEKNYKAMPLLAAYRKPADLPAISELLKSTDIDNLYYGLQSVVNYPSPTFFPELKRLIYSNVNFAGFSSVNERVVRRALYAAIIQYKNLASKELLETELRNTDVRDSITKTDLMFQALKQYPDSIYLGLIPFNFFTPLAPYSKS